MSFKEDHVGQTTPRIYTNPEDLPSSFHDSRNVVELQKLLIDERIRCETHKTNYQTLKEEHKRLQDEFVKLQNDFASFHDNKVDPSDQLQELVRNLQSQLATKNRQVEELRGQTLHPHKLELIKAEITNELEEPLKAHLISMDKEVEKYRIEYNNVRYQFTFLSAELDHAKSEHARNLEELKLRHQAQMSALQRERDDLLNSQKNTVDVDAQKILQLQRQKSQFEQRIKSLLDEIAELQKQKEKICLDADTVQRCQVKEISQLRANIQAIENDKRSSDFQCERLQKELRESNEENSRFNQQIQNLNRECAALKNLSDEESHRHKVALTNHRLEALKLKGDLERERDSLVHKSNNLEAEIELLRAFTENHQKDLEDLEREASKRIQDAREEEWNKNNILQTEKIELEERNRELELRLEAEKSSRLNEREESNEKLRTCEMREIQMNSEIKLIKKQLASEIHSREKLEKNNEDISLLRQRLLEREHELQTMTSLRQQAINEVEHVKELMRDLRTDAESARNQANRIQAESERTIEAYKLECMEEKHRLQSRSDQMEHKMRQNIEKHERTSKHLKKVKQLLLNKLKQAKKKIELLDAEREKLEIELKAGRHGVPVDEHNKLRHRLRDINRRHNEFRHLIGLGEHVIPAGFNMDDQSLFGSNCIAGITSNNGEFDLLNKKELSTVLKRLDQIAQKQKEQNDALDAVALTNQNVKIPVGRPDYTRIDISPLHSKQSSPRNDPNILVGVDDDRSLLKTSPISGRSQYEDDFTSSSSGNSRA